MYASWWCFYSWKLSFNKDKLIGKTAFAEYRCRSGVKEVPSHGNVIKILDDESTRLPNNIEEES